MLPDRAARKRDHGLQRVAMLSEVERSTLHSRSAALIFRISPQS